MHVFKVNSDLPSHNYLSVYWQGKRKKDPLSGKTENDRLSRQLHSKERVKMAALQAKNGSRPIVWETLADLSVAMKSKV